MHEVESESESESMGMPVAQPEGRNPNGTFAPGHTWSVGNKGGRPLKFQTVEDLQKALDAYFASCYDFVRDMWGNRIHDKEHPDYKKPSGRGKNRKPGNIVFVMKKVKAFTVTGIAIALGTTRETILNYEDGRYDDYDEDGKPVELSVEERQYNEQVAKFSDTIRLAKQLCYEDTEQYLYRPGTATGAKFSLVNNYGWVDKSTVETVPERRNAYEKLDEATLRKLAAEGDDADIE